MTTPSHFGPAAPFGAFPPGHFYSPIPSRAEVELRAPRLFGPPPVAIPGIDLRAGEQLAFLERIAGWYDAHPFPSKPTAPRRYFFDNPRFAAADALALYGVMRHARPRRVVEVGSGFSSCAMLDVAETSLGGAVQFTFIEPYPETLLAHLREEDHARVDVRVTAVQDVPSDVFESLEADDVLFIDSTHVSKLGSDVNRLFLEVLPALRPGVYVHVHDIFYPFEYPREWFDDGRAWNEAYLLRAFLAFNAGFEIVLWNDWVQRMHADRLDRMPLWKERGGGSLWLRRR